MNLNIYIYYHILHYNVFKTTPISMNYHCMSLEHFGWGALTRWWEMVSDLKL